MMSAFKRDRFTWLVYLNLALYAYFLNCLGPLTPFLKDELALSYTVSSLHFTAFAVGMLLAGFIGDRVIRPLGYWRALWVAAGGLSLGALGLAAGRSAVITIGSAFVMGVIGSLAAVAVPALLATWHGEWRAVAISEANTLASVASTAAPLWVGWAAQAALGWRWGLALTVLVPLGLYLFAGRSAPPAESTPATALLRAGGRLPGRYWLYWTGLLLAVAAEFCMIAWGADYLETHLGAPKADAAQALSFFLAAMIVGRFSAGWLVRRFAARRVVTASVLIAGLGFAVFWTAGAVWPALAGLGLTGLGVASLFPLFQSLAIGAAPANPILAGARTTLASGLAILTLPLILGRLADWVGLRAAYSVEVFLILGLLAVLALTASRTIRPSWRA